MLQSCLPEHKVAKTFIDSPHMINLLVNPPAMVFKFNHKGEAIEDFDSLKPIIQDSLLWTNSRYMQYMNDSVLLENYMNNFIEGLRLNGFNVYLNTAIDSFSTEKPQSYVLDVSQVQLDEYLYPLEDEDSFLDTIYIKKFKLNAVDFSCWLNLGKAGSAILDGNPECYWGCGNKASQADLLIEHDAGGDDSTANLVPSCRTCNSKRGAIYVNNKTAQRQQARNAALNAPPKQNQNQTFLDNQSSFNIIT